MSDTRKGGRLAKMLSDKRRWRQYKARVKQLPPDYRATVDAIERYLMRFGPMGDTDSASSLFDDVADLFERAAADRTPIRQVVGADPVDFVDALIRNYAGSSGWVNQERDRLTSAIDRAAGDDSGNEGASR